MEGQGTSKETITTPPTSRSGPAPTSVTELPVEISDPSVPIHPYALRSRPITHSRGSVGTRGLPSRVGSMQDLPTGLESSGDAILDVQYPQLPAVGEMAAAFPLPVLSEVADVSDTDSIYPSPEVVTSEYTHNTTTAITTSSSPSTTSSYHVIYHYHFNDHIFLSRHVSCPPGQLAMAGDHTSSHYSLLFYTVQDRFAFFNIV